MRRPADNDKKIFFSACSTAFYITMLDCILYNKGGAVLADRPTSLFESR